MPAAHNASGYAPPIILGSAYGYRAITRIPPAVRRVIIAHARLVTNPEADLSELDEDTVLAILEGRHAMEMVVSEALAYWNGMLDARCGTKDEKAPAERGGMLEIQYLRGFIDGHLGEHAPKYDFSARNASRSPYRIPMHDNATPERPPAEQAAAAQAGDVADVDGADNVDYLSVHSAGTDIPMPDTPFLSMAALVGYDERDGSPTSFQRYVMDEATYPGQPPHAACTSGTETIENDDDAYEYFYQEDPLTPRSFVPVPQGVPPRCARHLNPSRGPLEVRAIPEIPLPEGVDRDTIAQEWDPAQRSALFDYDGEIAWMESEDKAHPANAYQLAEAFTALAATVFPGEQPPRPVIPFVNGSGKRPNSIAVIGTIQQIDHLVTSGTWATSWVCAQFFPNRPRPLRFVCTFGGLRLRLHEHHKAKQMIRTALEDSVEVAEFTDTRGLILAPVLDTLEVQHMQIAGKTEPEDLWNVVMTPPSEDLADQKIWRLTVANVRPRDPLRGELFAYTHPFKCGTCGCLTHPRRLCPTAAAPGWTGTIPRWGVNKALWSSRAKSLPPRNVKIRDVDGQIVRAPGSKMRPIHKALWTKSRRFSKVEPRGLQTKGRRARLV